MPRRKRFFFTLQDGSNASFYHLKTNEWQWKNQPFKMYLLLKWRFSIAMLVAWRVYPCLAMFYPTVLT